MMPIPVAMMSHDEESHVALNFKCQDLRCARVALIMMLSSHHTDIGANGVTPSKMSC